MNTSKKLLRIGSWVSLVLFLLVLGGSAMAAYAATAMPANGGLIRGKVTSPGGYPLPGGTLVKLFDSDVETVHGQAIPDPDDGAFQIGPVPNGLYVLKAVPAVASGYTQSRPKAVSVVNAPVNVGVLVLTEPQISGEVFAPDGVTLVDAEVLVYLGNGQVLQKAAAPGGEFSIGGLPPGGYGLRAFPAENTPAGDLPYWKSDRSAVSVPAPTEPQTVTLTLVDADLWGYVQDDQGVPVGWAKVFATAEGGRRTSDFSNANGYWAIGGLADGDYQLDALPPWAQSGLLPPDTLDITLPGAANPYTLVFGSPPKEVLGNVVTNAGVSVSDAQVVARRVNKPGGAEALTGPDGAYQLDLSPGLWALTVRPVTDTVPADWVYPHPPQLVHFSHNNEPETRQQDFTVLTADAGVTGEVEMPDGSTPVFTVTVGLHNDEGVGMRTDIDPADGSFDLDLPSGGYKVFVHPHDPGYLGPVMDPITVLPDEIYDLGTLTLLQRDAVISGTVSVDGAGVQGIPVVAWRPGVPGNVHTTSGPEGVYALAVSAGDWHIQPAPSPDQPYLYTGAGQDLSLAAGETAPDIDFDLLAADATISGDLVDEHGDPVDDASGWAAAFQVGAPEIHNGAPIESGAFTIQVPAGTYNVAAHLPAGCPYTSTGERQVTVGSGENVHITMDVQVKDARIAGPLWDPRNSDIVEGVAGWVGAWSDGDWVAAPINDEIGAYRLDVAAGLWHLNYRINPQAGYAKISGPQNIPVQTGQTAVVPLKIIPKDGMISGTVLAPDGSPLAGAKVRVKGVGQGVDDLWLGTLSEEDGTFSLEVPYGSYRLGAANGSPDWIKPAERLVEVDPGGISADHVLQFREPDSTISGTLTVENAPEDGVVFLWAWSEDGGFVHDRFPVTSDGDQASGPYQIGVISGTVWHLGAAMETGSQFWFGQAEVSVDSDDVQQDLTLEGPYPKPAPVVVTFDAAEPQHVALTDGTHIFIPAGALPVVGQVTLRVAPIATLPHQQHANVLRYGYAFLATDASGEPIEDHFNQDVLITFAYDDAQLENLHIHEPWLKPAYFSTTTDSWTFPQSYVVDTDANQVSMQIDHFTDYALTGTASYFLFLPMAQH